MKPVRCVRKRDGRLVDFDESKIADAIYKAALSVGGEDRFLAEELAGSDDSLALRYSSAWHVFGNHERICAALLDGLIHAARRGDFHSVVALIDGGNTVSVRLHERFGFRHIGTFPQVGFKFGRWLDVIHMQKMLE